MRQEQHGFSVIGVVLVLLVVALIGITGWYVFKQQSTSKSNPTQQSQQAIKKVSATDSTKTFSYSYPSNWSLQKYVWQGCCSGAEKSEPDWSKQTRPITLKEGSYPLDAAIKIDDFGPNAIEREYSNQTIDKFNTYNKLKVNGYDALYHVSDFIGPSEAEKYKDHEYIISNSDATRSVRIQFRERYSNSTINGEHDFNAAVLVPDFEKIVESVKFLDNQTTQPN